MSRFVSLLLFFSLCALLFALFPAHALEQVSIQLPWHHQFQFAGYYMAKAQGYYQDAGP